MNVKSRINKESRAICRYRGLIISRIILIIFLLVSCCWFYMTSLYIAAALAVFPEIIHYGIQSAHPKRNQEYLEHAFLAETMKSCRFTYNRYQSETIFSFLIILLLAVWLFAESQYQRVAFWQLPAIFIVIYFMAGRVIYFYCRLKLHYDFMHLNI